MTISVDILLRGMINAQTITLDNIPRAPQQWTDDDVRALLEGMLRALDRQKNPGGEERAVALRGLSWIVNPYEEGGVVIAIEITMGAAVAGPFAIDQAKLESMITRVLARTEPPSAVH